MSKHTPAGPWTEYRTLAESIGQAVAVALKGEVGTVVELGRAISFIPEERLVSRLLPMRAHVVRFRRPLRDVMIFLTPLRDEVVRPLIDAAASAAIASLEIPTGVDEHGAHGTYDIEPACEYETMDVLLEQCDGLYLEASYSLDLPSGELQMVLGTGLLESASAFLIGIADPLAEEPIYAVSGPELRLGNPIEQDEVVEDIGGAQPAVAASADPMSSIDAFERELAAQERAEAAASAAIAGANAAAVAGPLPTAPPAPAGPSAADLAASQRWTQLLSGVEVELSAELGRTHLALGDITALDSASVLTLDQLVHDPVTVYVNGTPYASARLVVVDGEYGIEIIEVIEQAVLTTSLAA